MGLILILFALVALIDLSPLIRKRSWRGVITFLCFFIPALVVAILINRKVEVPSTMQVVEDAFKSLGLSY